MKRGNPKFTNRPIGLFKTQTEAAKIMNVSVPTIQRVKQVEPGKLCLNLDKAIDVKKELLSEF